MNNKVKLEMYEILVEFKQLMFQVPVVHLHCCHWRHPTHFIGSKYATYNCSIVVWEQMVIVWLSACNHTKVELTISYSLCSQGLLNCSVGTNGNNTVKSALFAAAAAMIGLVAFL